MAPKTIKTVNENNFWILFFSVISLPYKMLGAKNRLHYFYEMHYFQIKKIVERKIKIRTKKTKFADI